MSWMVAKLSIEGIRGVLDRAGEFELAENRSPRSIAIYAPNACGKSGYADAVEYFFSEDGSVIHLGKGETDSERGGKHAIPHVLAEERGIEPKISMMLVHSETGESLQITRLVKTGQADSMPSELGPILRAAPAHRVLRQHDLRRFVVDMAPGEKYAELSRWFGLTRLEQLLRHLGTTSNVLESTNLGREIEERVQDIARYTNGSVTEYDERAVLNWCTIEAERHLGKSLAIDSLEALKKAIRTLKRLQGRIILLSEAAESYQAKLALDQIATNLVSQEGQLQICNRTLARAVAAEEKTNRVLGAAKDSVFQEVWDAAQEVLESQIMDQCPVCLTPWGRTRVGSQEGAVITLTRSRSKLTKLVAARNEQQKAAREIEMAFRELEVCLAKISTAARKLSLSEIETQATGLVKAIKTLSTTHRLPSQIQGEGEALLSRCRQFVERLHPALQSLQVIEVPATTTQVEATIDRLQALQDTLGRLAELHREQEEFRKVERSFNFVAEVIRERTAAMVNNIVAALQNDVQSIYHTIYPTDAIPNLHIIPDTQSRTLALQVGFHSPERTVPPAGYLSESQINTLGLALFTSSVGLFNGEFPFLFLDDIVSSYDADHRERIVDVVAERLSGFQVFLTTHDWHFYSMLKSRLSDKGWLFERILGWDFEHGPRREVDVP